MSGGSLSYLYNKQFPEVCNYIGEMKKVEKELISQGYTDIARDVRRLIEYCLTAENRISVLFDNLSDVFHAVEWYYSSDYGEKDMLEVLDEYRAGQLKPVSELLDEKIVHIEKPNETFPQFKQRLKEIAVETKCDAKGNFHGVKLKAIYNRNIAYTRIVMLGDGGT